MIRLIEQALLIALLTIAAVGAVHFAVNVHNVFFELRTPFRAITENLQRVSK